MGVLRAGMFAAVYRLSHCIILPLDRLHGVSALALLLRRHPGVALLVDRFLNLVVVLVDTLTRHGRLHAEPPFAGYDMICALVKAEEPRQAFLVLRVRRLTPF